MRIERLGLVIVGVVSLAIAASITQHRVATARPIIGSLLDNVRLADVIATGIVSEVATNSISLDVQIRIKGELDENKLAVFWNEIETPLYISDRFAIGDEIIFLVTKRNSSYELVSPNNALLELDSQIADKYHDVLDSFLHNNSPITSDGKQRLFAELMALLRPEAKKRFEGGISEVLDPKSSWPLEKREEFAWLVAQRITPESAHAYRVSIDALLEFETGELSKRPTDTVVRLLTSKSPLTRHTGLNLIGRNYSLLDADVLRPIVLEIAQGPTFKLSARAAQVLPLISVREETVPMLIELLASKNVVVARAAYSQMENLIDTELTFDPEAPLEERVRSAREWRNWWNASQE